jgi:hypothetical protein
VNAYREAAARVGAWLEAHFDAGGNCTIDAERAQLYPKAPYLLTMVGKRALGARVGSESTAAFHRPQWGLYRS